MIRVAIPYHLRTLAHVTGEIELDVPAPVTIARTLDALEAKYPMLRGTIRDHGTLHRRPFVRYFASEQDWSNIATDTTLPDSITSGQEPFLIVGAIAGG
jgi:hypothetical protein